MRWSSEAEAALKKVPFFVRKKVKVRVETEARDRGKTYIGIAEVTATQKRYLNNMGSQIKGYQLDTCFGAGGCPNVTNDSSNLSSSVETVLEEVNLLKFLSSHVKGGLKSHHEFKVTFTDCPNACSQPQIKDLGIIGAAMPVLSDEECTFCGACQESCRENAITLDENKNGPVVDETLCVACGKCMKVCPTCTLVQGEKGYRILVGGKLGRHPKLATELSGIKTPTQVIEILKTCIDFYKTHSKNGQRFAEVVNQKAHIDFFHVLDEI